MNNNYMFYYISFRIFVYRNGYESTGGSGMNWLKLGTARLNVDTKRAWVQTTEYRTDKNSFWKDYWAS